VLGHTSSGQALILQLASLVARFTPGSTGVMDDAYPSISFVLILATLAPGPEGLDFTVLQGDTEK
jgi:hypothetical protein